MIERKFVSQNIKEFLIEEYITKSLKNVGHSHTRVQKTPLGEKIIIHASRPGLIVGRKGQNIKKLTSDLKKMFGLENPQIEIAEVENINLDAQIVAERIANSLERFGSARFKGIGHKVMNDVMNAGALGVEILVSGKIPSARAKRWRFYQGYLKKSGDVSLSGVDVAFAYAQLKTGTIGIKVSIMPPDIKLPDDIQTYDTPIEIDEEIKEVEEKEQKKKKGMKKKKSTRKKKAGGETNNDVKEEEEKQGVDLKSVESQKGAQKPEKEPKEKKAGKEIGENDKSGKEVAQ